MATYTSNINLKKPAQSDKIRIADFNTNADNIDDAFGAGFGQSSKPSVNAEINSLADGIAIVSQGDVHGAITSGQFVYVRNHSTLSNGMYVANQNISANAALTRSNLDEDSSGGLNALSAKFTVDDLMTTATNVTSGNVDMNLNLNSKTYRFLNVRINATSDNSAGYRGLVIVPLVNNVCSATYFITTVGASPIVVRIEVGSGKLTFLSFINIAGYSISSLYVIGIQGVM